MAGDRREGDVARGAMTGRPVDPRAPRALFDGGQEVRVPVVEEQISVGKRDVETGRVRVHTVVDEEKLNLTELLERDIVEIERVPVGREVAQAPLPFEEGDVLVIPVIEERLVVEKRLVVVEEVRIRRRQERAPANIPVTRRVMHAEIERSAPPPPPGPPPQAADPRPQPAAALRDPPRPSRSGMRNEAIADGPARAGAPSPFHPQAGAQPTAKGGSRIIVAAVLVAILLLLLVLASQG